MCSVTQFQNRLILSQNFQQRPLECLSGYKELEDRMHFSPNLESARLSVVLLFIDNVLDLSSGHVVV